MYILSPASFTDEILAQGANQLGLPARRRYSSTDHFLDPESQASKARSDSLSRVVHCLLESNASHPTANVSFSACKVDNVPTGLFCCSLDSFESFRSACIATRFKAASSCIRPGRYLCQCSSKRESFCASPLSMLVERVLFASSVATDRLMPRPYSTPQP